MSQLGMSFDKVRELGFQINSQMLSGEREQKGDWGALFTQGVQLTRTLSAVCEEEAQVWWDGPPASYQGP